MPELDKYRENACQKLELIISYLGVTANVSCPDSAGKKLKLKVESDDAGRIIGRRGRTLASIQLLLNSAMHQSDDPLPEIVIEIEGYDRHKREEEGNGRRRNSKRERNDKNRGGRNDRNQKDDDNDSDNDDRKKSRRRNNQKSDEGRGREKKNAKPQDAFSQEDAEYFVDTDEINNVDEEVETATQDVAEPVEQTEPVSEPVETVSEAPAEPTAAPAEETTPESPKSSSGERLPDNVFQCRQKALDAAKEVRRWGEEVALRGMTSEERKAVKEALQDDPLIDVVEGEVTGPDKRKVIIRERSIEEAVND